MRLLSRNTGILFLLFGLPLATAVACGDDVPGEDDSAFDEDGSLGGSGNEPGSPSGGADGAEQGEPCLFGEDPDKCEGSVSQVCAPFLSETGTTCESDSDCEEDELCFEDADAMQGICLRISGECRAQCGGDFDCEADEFCDPGSGLCSATEQVTRNFGDSCSLQENTPTCAGDCVAVSDLESECEEKCRVGAVSGCGEQVLEGSGVACAFFAYDLSDIDVTQGAGDAGVCAHLCNCSSECPGAQRCLKLATDGYDGVCAGGVAEEDALFCENNLGGAGGS